MANGIFTYQYRVTYGDCTVGNHVYYARYLDILEAARGELFRQGGLSLSQLQAEGFAFPVIECRLRYKAPARYDDGLRVEVWLRDLSRLRVEFGYRIVNQSDRLILEAESLHVCAGLDERPRRMSEAIRQMLVPFHQVTSAPAG